MSLAILWLALLPLHMPWVSLASLPPQSPCERAVIGSDEVLASKSMDVDLDGRLDTVIIHGRGDLFLAIISNASLPDCKVVLNTYLTFRDLINGRRQVTIRAIELVEVTGDDQPELHVAVDERGPSPRVSDALHRIYAVQNGGWKEIFVYGPCLDLSSFEFRDNPNGKGKDIYVDSDSHCDPPFSSGRNYSLLRWDGSKFVTVESGYKENPNKWVEFLVLCCAPLLALILLPFVALGVLVYILGHIRISKEVGAKAGTMTRMGWRSWTSEA